MRLALAVLAALVTAVLLPAAAPAATTCTSGKTLRKDADVRVFSTRHGESGQRIHACRKGARKPTLLYEDLDGVGELEILVRQGARIVYFVDICCSGESDGGWVLGWLDVKTGQHRSRLQEGIPATAVAVGADGSVAIDRDSAIALMRPAGKRGLTAPKKVGASELPLVASSLRLRAGRISWTTKAGTRATIGVDGVPVPDPDPSPVCRNGAITVTEGQTATVPLTCEDTGPQEGQTPLRFVFSCRSCGSPLRGTLGKVEPGPPASITYTARKGSVGEDEIRFVAHDAHTVTKVARIDVTVVAAGP